jgi:hypothetical protein
MRRVRPLGRRSAAADRSRSSTCPRTLGFSLRRQLAQQTPRQPNRIGASKLRCPFAVRSSYFYHSILNRIRSADRTALKLSRKFLPDNRSLQRRVSRLAASLFEAAPDVYPPRPGGLRPLSSVPSYCNSVSQRWKQANGHSRGFVRLFCRMDWGRDLLLHLAARPNR